MILLCKLSASSHGAVSRQALILCTICVRWHGFWMDVLVLLRLLVKPVEAVEVGDSSGCRQQVDLPVLEMDRLEDDLGARCEDASEACSRGEEAHCVRWEVLQESEYSALTEGRRRSKHNCCD